MNSTRYSVKTKVSNHTKNEQTQIQETRQDAHNHTTATRFLYCSYPDYHPPYVSPTFQPDTGLYHCVPHAQTSACVVWKHSYNVLPSNNRALKPHSNSLGRTTHSLRVCRTHLTHLPATNLTHNFLIICLTSHLTIRVQHHCLPPPAASFFGRRTFKNVFFSSFVPFFPTYTVTPDGIYLKYQKQVQIRDKP